MSIADEWKEFVRHCQCWHTEEALEREVSDIRKLEADFAEAVDLLRRCTVSGFWGAKNVFLNRIDAEKRDGGT